MDNDGDADVAVATTSNVYYCEQISFQTFTSGCTSIATQSFTDVSVADFDGYVFGRAYFNLAVLSALALLRSLFRVQTTCADPLFHLPPSTFPPTQ